MSEESELEARAIRVSNFLVKKDKASALAACLQNPPVNEKTERSEELKVPARRNLCPITPYRSVACFLYRREIWR
jgi:hypothetical protein